MNIETGCKAIIVKASTGVEGKSVVVGNYLGYVPGFGGNSLAKLKKR